MDAAVIHVAPKSPASITTYREPIVCLDDDNKPLPVEPARPSNPRVDEVRRSLESLRSRARGTTLDEAWWLKLEDALRQCSTDVQCHGHRAAFGSVDLLNLWRKGIAPHLSAKLH